MIKAIIADDERAAGIVIQHLIERSRFPIEIIGTAANGPAALDLIRSGDPDLIFMDIRMPGMNGFEIMREEPRRRYIIVTAYESFRYAQEALRLGAKDILLKPVDYDMFCSAVKRAIGWEFTQNDLTNDILEYLHGNFDKNIEVNQLAKLFYTTPGNIARTFKNNTGTSIIAYLHAIRIKNAIDML